jgi:NADPH:quinone reductase-like Zn-dependent oxidoreductase
VLPIPDHISYEQAAATLWAYSTPLNCATRRAPVSVGDTVVITGASGGLATACAQLGKIRGAKVIGTTTKPQRAEELKSIGYHIILDANGPDLAGAVKEHTGGLGADAVWDCVGGTDYFRLAVSCTRIGGAVAVLGAPVTEDGFDLAMNTLSFIFGELDVVGVRGATRRDQELCMQLLSEGRIRPVIDRVFLLAEAAEAHRYLEKHQQVGRVLLAP